MRTAEDLYLGVHLAGKQEQIGLKAPELSYAIATPSQYPKLERCGPSYNIS